jgi:hypothetical protein
LREWGFAGLRDLEFGISAFSFRFSAVHLSLSGHSSALLRAFVLPKIKHIWAFGLAPGPGMDVWAFETPK